MTTSDHHKKSELVLLKSHVLFYRQVNKASKYDSFNTFLDGELFMDLFWIIWMLLVI